MNPPTTITTSMDHGFTVGDTIEVPACLLFSPPILGGKFDAEGVRYVITSVDSTTLTISEPKWYDLIKWWLRDVWLEAVLLWNEMQEARCETER